MKELAKGVWTLIWALLVSSLMYSIGTLYSLCYSIWLTVTMKKWYAFFQFWWRLVDGFCAVIGFMLMSISIGLDMGWNVNGEIIEDLITTEENTEFSKKNITVSASTGKLEIEGKLNPFGKKFSSTLNFFFGQKQHARDSWLYDVAKRDLEKGYFNK